MLKLEWSSVLDTGIEEIDNQHRRLVDYINELGEARKTNDMKLVGKVIDDTIDYTISHFGFEESLIEEAGYKMLRPHKKVHELFVRRVADFQKRFKAGEDISEELHALLSRWLVSHIKHDDHAYAECVKKYLNLPDTPKRQQTWIERFFGM